MNAVNNLALQDKKSVKMMVFASFQSSTGRK